MLEIADLTAKAWDDASPIALTHTYVGLPAPAHRHAEARVLWNRRGLWTRFVCAQGEPLVVRATPDRTRKVMGLWDYDVCELFVAPDPSAPTHYFEFEVAPTGEWLDVELHWHPDRRDSNWAYHSGMSAATRVAPDAITLAMAIPWSAFGRQPRPGDNWFCNLFRCVGELGESRGYLAWQPTRTAEPAFHVPQAFAALRFES